MLGRRQAANKGCSNRVINLSPDKARVFGEAYRALEPGGRLTVSDIVPEGALPEKISGDSGVWAGCIARALQRREYLRKMKGAGFEDAQVLSRKESYLKGVGGVVKVRVDRDLCIGVGNCVAHAPTVFELDEQNKAAVIDPSSVDDNTLLEAAKSCPESAILVGDNEGNHLYPRNPAVTLIAT